MAQTLELEHLSVLGEKRFAVWLKPHEMKSLSLVRNRKWRQGRVAVSVRRRNVV